MLFNSLTFAVFFVITYALYICMRHRMQNVLLLSLHFWALFLLPFFVF